jgi:HPt (histidine-containing phosphotransfer) domain-containing protein
MSGTRESCQADPLGAVESCPLDLQRLDEISGGDQEQEQELMDEFLRKSPRLVLAMEDAIAVADPTALRRAVHLLRRAAVSIAASALARACRELEQSARLRLPRDAEDLAEEVRSRFLEIVDFARDHFLSPSQI